MEPPHCCSAEAPLRDERLGRPVDVCWFIRWFKLHAFYQIVATICRRLDYKDYYNTLPELYPQVIYKQYKQWQYMRPRWSISEICFRMVFKDVFTALIFALIVGGLKMGCTQILVNLVYFVTDPKLTQQSKQHALKQLGAYIGIFVLRVLINQQSTRLINIASIKIQLLLHLKIYDKLLKISKTYLKHLTKADLLYLFRGETKLIYDGMRLSSGIVSGITTLVLCQIFLCIRLGKIGWILLPVIVISLCLQVLINFRKSQINHEKLSNYQQRLAMNINFYDQFSQIKIMQWQDIMLRKNKQARNIENKKHVMFFIYQNVYLFTVAFIPSLIMIFFLLAGYGMNQLNNTSPRRAYTVYTYVIMIQVVMRSIPYAVVNIFQAINAGKRLANFFTAEQITNILDINLEPGTIVINNLIASIEDHKSIAHLVKKYKLSSNFQYSKSLIYLLQQAVSKQYQIPRNKTPQFQYFNLLFKDITIQQNLKFNKGQRVIILTLDINISTELLKTVIGHLTIQQGSIKYNGKIGYINTRQFYFLRESIKNNIIFKGKYDEQKLKDIIRLLDLDLDFIRLIKGIDTVVSDSNLLLSTYQKKKISLARILYNGADILLLDNFFDDMQPDEIMDLYNKYCTILNDKLLMITTKKVFYLKPQDKIIITQFGKIIQYGSYKNLSHDIHSRIHDFTIKNMRKLFVDRLIPEKHRITKRFTIPIFNFDHTVRVEYDDLCHVQGSPVALLNPQLQLTQTLQRQILLPVKPLELPLKSTTKSPYITWKHYSMFLKSSSLLLYIIIFILIILSAGVRIFSDWWIGTYSSSYSAQQSAPKYIGIYISISFISAILTLASGLLSPFVSVITTQNIMSRAMKKAFYADIRIYKVISRLAISYLLSKDNEDFFYINQYIFSFFKNFFLFLGTFIVLGLTSWISFPVSGVLIIANLIMMYYYQKAFMQIFDLGDPFRNQYNQILEDVILSVDTIRTQEKEKQFRKTLMDVIYRNSSVYKMNSRYCSHGLSMFGQIVTIIIVLTIGFIIIYYKSNNYPLTIKQILLASTSLSMSSRLPMYIQQASSDFVFFTMFSNVSVKLLVDKINNLVPSMPDIFNLQKSQNILINNSITLQNITYKSSGQKLDILDDISLKIDKNSFAGFYSGSTGDLQTLFYIISTALKPMKNKDGTFGKVYFGNWDVQTFPEEDIFNNLMILGINPVTFNGSLRQNIDPYNKYTDSQIIFALKEVKFWDQLWNNSRISKLPNFGTLDFYVQTNEGDCLPYGYAVKINVARALVRKPNILLMYYALRNTPTYMKDYLRQAIYRNLKGKSTILMASLDIVQLLKCDYLIGLQDGKIDEQGRSQDLLKNPNSRLSKMIDILVPNQLIDDRRQYIHHRVAQTIQNLINQSKYNNF